MTDKEVKQRLLKIRTAEDFKTIFNITIAQAIGSPRRHADELLTMTPDSKKALARSAIAELERNYSYRNWNYAGD